MDDDDPDEYHPHHDREGRFVTEDGRHIRICDCLSSECSGSFLFYKPYTIFHQHFLKKCLFFIFFGYLKKNM